MLKSFHEEIDHLGTQCKPRRLFNGLQNEKNVRFILSKSDKFFLCEIILTLGDSYFKSLELKLFVSWWEFEAAAAAALSDFCSVRPIENIIWTITVRVKPNATCFNILLKFRVCIMFQNFVFFFCFCWRVVDYDQRKMYVELSKDWYNRKNLIIHVHQKNEAENRCHRVNFKT